MTYTIETVRTVAGNRYYVRGENGKLIRAGYGTKTAALEHIKFLQVMDQAQAELRAQIANVRQVVRP